MSYELKLPQFEGPFDLLLFFIERDEIDIQDIPISRITDDFLHYLRDLQDMNIDMASEFILVAATLMRIKAKMLLPRKEIDEAGNEVDPRQELVTKLIEYKRYKEVAADMQKLEEWRSSKLPRGNISAELKDLGEKYSTETELSSLSLFKLLKAFEKVMARMKEVEELKHKVARYEFTIEDEKESIRVMLSRHEKMSFTELFQTCKSRMQAIFRFLALLEEIQNKLAAIQTGLGVNNFWVGRYEEAKDPELHNG